MKKILITYATKAGSTQEIAEYIGTRFDHNPLLAPDVLEIHDVTNLQQYDCIIIGSPIRVGAWLPAAKDFVLENFHTLKTRPTAYFTVCNTLKEDTPENRSIVKDYLTPIHDILEPTDDAMFAGRIDKSKLNAFERLMIWFVRAQEGDFREWDKVNTWIDHLATDVLLLPQPT